MIHIKRLLVGIAVNMCIIFLVYLLTLIPNFLDIFVCFVMALFVFGGAYSLGKERPSDSDKPKKESYSFYKKKIKNDYQR